MLYFSFILIKQWKITENKYGFSHLCQTRNIPTDSGETILRAGVNKYKLIATATSTYTITIYYCPVAGDVYLCSTYSTRILSSTVFWLKQEKHFYADDPHVYIEKISWYFTAV